MGKTGITMTKVDLRKMQQLIQDAPQQVDRAARIVCTEMVADMVGLMLDSPPDGEEYVRGNDVHTASSPGNAPRPDLASLMDSLTWRKVGDLSYRVEDGVEHGIYMEEGTETVEPRPFVQPVFEEYRAGKFVSIMKQELSF